MRMESCDDTVSAFGRLSGEAYTEINNILISSCSTATRTPAAAVWAHGKPSEDGYTERHPNQGLQILDIPERPNFSIGVVWAYSCRGKIQYAERDDP